MQKYEILRVIGEGAYGIVLECRNKDSGRIVAIKKFKDGSEDELSERSPTMREVKILKSLNNDNVVHLIEAFKRKGKLYLVFEFVEQNLLELLESGDACGLRPELIRKYTFQICCALKCCHEQGIVHRDDKPENLLVDSKSQILKLCDFGFARTLTGEENDLTDYVATRWYRPPELLLGSTNYGFTVDTWAIGCIIGEMSDTYPLFPGDSEVDQLFLIQRLLGSLTKDQLELFQRNPRFLGVKFPDTKASESLQNRYSGKIIRRGLELMSLMLQMDPIHRPSMKQCLEHSYFDGMVEGTGQEVSITNSRHSSGHRRRLEAVESGSAHSRSSNSDRDNDSGSITESIGNATIDSFDMEPYGYKDEIRNRFQSLDDIIDANKVLPRDSDHEEYPFKLPTADSKQHCTPRMQNFEIEKNQSSLKLASLSRSQFDTKELENSVYQTISSKKNQISLLIEEARNHIRSISPVPAVLRNEVSQPAPIMNQSSWTTSDISHVNEMPSQWNTKQKMGSEDNFDLPRLTLNEADEKSALSSILKKPNGRNDRYSLADAPNPFKNDKTPRREEQMPEVLQAASRALLRGDVVSNQRSNEELKSARSRKSEEKKYNMEKPPTKDHSVHFTESKNSNAFLKPANMPQIRHKNIEESKKVDDSDISFDMKPNRNGRRGIESNDIMNSVAHALSVNRHENQSSMPDEKDSHWRNGAGSFAANAEALSGYASRYQHENDVDSTKH